MKTEDIRELLKDFDQVHVTTYINYIESLKTLKKGQKLVAPWLKKVKAQDLAEIFAKVAKDGLYIEGDTITLEFPGKLGVNYNYQAYKNKLLQLYPETTFDHQIVHEGDTFDFRKESGEIIYTHDIKNPFDRKKEIIGCYCIVINSRGNYIELLNMDEVEKMKAVSKNKDAWENWEGEMVLKSGIKRVCKRNFKDLVSNMDNLDNDLVDLENITVPNPLQLKISKCKSIEDINLLYEAEKETVDDEVIFLKLLSDRRLEIEDINKMTKKND